MRFESKTVLGWVLTLSLVLPLHSATVIETDVCVYGGTSAGIMAAVQAARMGHSVVIVEPGRFLGGLTTGGLGATDIGNKAAIGGLSREFYRRVARHYAQESAWKYETAQEYFTRRGSGQARASQLEGPDATMWTFEPSVARNIFQSFLNEYKIPVYREHKLTQVIRTQDGKRLVQLDTDREASFRARQYIDCTYEGDLMAKARVSYHVGREANALYGETLNGIRAETPKHQFLVPVDPYIVPGDPKSDLLPFIQPGDGGKPGEGDHRVQAYNYRLCFTTNAANRKPVEPPPDYNPAQFELLARYLEALVAAGRKPTLSQFWNPIWMPNQKTDINNNGGFSTDFIGMNYDYPEADYATRERIAKAHENYIRGFITFLATSPRVPENMRREMQQWGMAADEFPETGGWPQALYVREARRMVGTYVMTEKNCRYLETVTDSIGLAAYNMDSHNCQRIVKNGRVENEGDVQVPPMKPYPISYRAITPKEGQCENLLVPVCLSASHIAYGSIRMEPVFMILAQSAATAAALAIQQNIPVQKVEYAALRRRLLADGQILEWSPTNTAAVDYKKQPGITVDDTEAEKAGPWQPSTMISARLLGTGYIHDNNEHKGEVSITYKPQIPKEGQYEIILLSPPHSNRAVAVPVTVSIGERSQTFKVNQRDFASQGFISLGKFSLPAGQSVTVTVSNRGTDGYVVADGLQVKPVGVESAP